METCTVKKKAFTSSSTTTAVVPVTPDMLAEGEGDTEHRDHPKF